MTEPLPSPLSVRIVRAFLCGLVFLLPLKFGTVVCVGEIGFFPLNGWEWLLTPWPPFLFPVLAGVGLVAAAWAGGPGRLPSRWLASLPLLWLALFLAAAVGLIRTTEWDYALLFLWQLLGVFCLVTAVVLMLPADPRLKAWLMAALLAGGALAMISGWHQVVGGGYKETLAYAEQQAQEQGGALPPQVASRLAQGRASGPFVYPNSFAAHVLLVGPLLLLGLWRLGHHFRPVRVSRILFLVGGVGLVGGAVLLSGSRAGLVGLGGGVAVACLFQRRLRWLRIPALVVCVAVLMGGLMAINRGRTSASLEARMGYWRGGWRMFLQHPFTGVGMGEFFPYYSRWKDPGAEDTRIPHNAAVLFTAQAGIAGGVAVLGMLMLPFVLPWLAGRWGRGTDGDGALLFAVQAGLAAWTLHALADFNMQISGTVATAGLLPLLLVVNSAAGPPPSGSKGWWLRAGLMLPALLAVAGIWRWSGERHYQQLYLYHRTPNATILQIEHMAEAAADRLPFSPYPGLVYGRAAEARGLTVLAAKGYEQALARAPHRGSIWYALARTRLQRGHYQLARQALANGIHWAPHDKQRQALEDRLSRDAPGIALSAACGIVITNSTGLTPTGRWRDGIASGR